MDSLSSAAFNKGGAMNGDSISRELLRFKDEGYAAMQRRIIPTAVPESIIGVRTPALRALARELLRNEDMSTFLTELPHRYFEENQLHAFLIAEEKDFERCMEYVNAFLPYIDNWATCDQLSPSVFKKEPDRLLPYIREWLKSDKTYTVRFAIGMLMQHFLDEGFRTEYADMVAAVRSDEYYVKMMIAWYFATALAKQYDAIAPYIEKKRLDAWTHNKTIQKAVESYRIDSETKLYLKTLRHGRHKA